MVVGCWKPHSERRCEVKYLFRITESTHNPPKKICPKQNALSLILYINGQVADLAPGSVIAQTRQVNDLNSIDNRQAGYTNKFSLPKSANNIRMMNGLTITGNNSAIPYIKNECSLYGSSGECFVYNGWAVVTDGGDSYDVVIYDGIIDLYKAIEGQNLSQIKGINALDHDKTVANITASWVESNNLPYRYILADYNGKTMYSSASVEADYLTPSVNVAWLWEKIFAHYKVNFNGSIFNTQHFKNLWMTYPKGNDAEANQEESFSCDTISIYNTATRLNLSTYGWRTLLLKFTDPSLSDSNRVAVTANTPHIITINQSGYYRISLSGNHNARDGAQLLLFKNLPPGADANALNTTWPLHYFIYDQPPGQDFSFTTRPLKLAAGDTLTLGMRHKHSQQSALVFNNPNESWGNMEAVVNYVSLGSADFSAAFADFPVKEFLNEIVHRFGLTLFKDKHTNSYTFSTLAELMQNPNGVDWSRKFIAKTEESYVYGSYAQQNWFRYLYNEKDASYNDGVISVPNTNLPEKRDVIKSKIYSPEQLQTNYLGQLRNVYKQYEKEVTQNSETGAAEVNYKPLDKRFYFLRAQPSGTSVNINSGTLETQGVGYPYVESYYRLSYTNVVQDFYDPLARIMDRALIISADMWLSETDVANADFSRLHYIEQLGGYFILNKIKNYIAGKTVNCEFVRAVYGASAQTERSLLLEKVLTQKLANNDLKQTLTYSATYNVPFIEVQYRSYGQPEWQTATETGGYAQQNTLVRYVGTYTPGPATLREFRLADTENNIYSNVLTSAYLQP